MNKRYQVFISSTWEDLKSERQAAVRAVLETDNFPAAMELGPARDETAWDLIRRTIDASDYFVLILGGRYGSLDVDGVGFTEKEYDYAKAKGIPILVFARRNPEKLPPSKRESIPAVQAKLDSFRAKVTPAGKPWTNSNELQHEVMKALTNAVSERPARGWVRLDDLPASEWTANSIDKRKVRLLRWEALEPHERQAYFQEFMTLTPQHHKPRALPVSLNRQLQLDRLNPIDLKPLTDLLRLFRLDIQGIALPLCPSDYDKIHHLDLTYAAHISDSVQRGVSKQQQEAFRQYVRYLSAAEMCPPEDELLDCDVIIVPGARKAIARRLEAAYSLASQSNAAVILSGFHPSYDLEQPLGIGEAEAMEYYLVTELGLDHSDTEIILESRARNTRETSIHIVPHLQRLHLEKKRPLKIVLVTSFYHMRRFALLMNHALEDYPDICDRLYGRTAASSFSHRLIMNGDAQAQERGRYGMGVWIQEYFKIIGGRVTGEF